MKRLLLLRHAKAVQDGKDGDEDRARILTQRGCRDAARIGRLMHQRGWVPDLVLCSTSVRTRQTWELAAAELRVSPPVEFLETLYLAPAKAMIAALVAAGGTAACVALVGHNPGTQDVAAMLARKPHRPDERSHLQAVKGDFPTAGLCVFACDIGHWRDLKPHGAELLAFVQPKELD